MISLIFPITKSSGIDNLKRTLENVMPNIETFAHVLCITSNKSLYLDCRKTLEVVFSDLEKMRTGDYLVSCADSDNLLEESKNLLNAGDRFVFLWNENTVLPLDAVLSLFRDFTQYPYSGFFSGVCNTSSYCVSDIWSSKPEFIENEMSEKLTKVDTAPVLGMLTRMSEFRKYKFDKKGDNLDFGLNLRRLGYENYIDTSIKYK